MRGRNTDGRQSTPVHGYRYGFLRGSLSVACAVDLRSVKRGGIHRAFFLSCHQINDYMPIRDQFCGVCNTFYGLHHSDEDCRKKVLADKSKRRAAIRAAIETIKCQKAQLGKHVSREQLRCWNVRLRNLYADLKSIR